MTAHDTPVATCLSTPRSLSGVMGIMVLAVYETDDVTSGRPAPASMRRTPDTAVPADIADDEGGHEPMHMGGHSGH